MNDVVVDKKKVMGFKKQIGEVIVSCPHCKKNMEIVTYTFPSERGVRCAYCLKTFNVQVR